MSVEKAAGQQPYLQEGSGLPAAVLVAESDVDIEARHRAAEFIGRVAVGRATTDLSSEATASTVRPIESLQDGIIEAAKGDKEARRMVTTNVRTDVVERTIKSGHVIKVDLMVDEAGNIQQHGQSSESIQANSLRFASRNWQMKERVKAETTNSFRLKLCCEKGLLDDYYFVVVSRAADNMTVPHMDREGFFTDTMSCSLQLTTMEDGKLTTESAFVAGVKSPGGPRHDQETLRGVTAELGIDLPDETATGTINTPFLIHKSVLQNGAIDLVKLWDKHVPKDNENEEIFFGESKPPQDYQEYLKVCREREERFEPKVQKITDRLISEWQHIKNHNRSIAVKRLHEISGEEMIEQALGDSDINPKVFGPVSAAEIEQARVAMNQGRYADALLHINTAKAYDESNSCPGALLDGGQSSDKNSSSSQTDECEFVSKKCPECGKRNVKTKITKTKITGSCGCSKSK